MKDCKINTLGTSGSESSGPNILGGYIDEIWICSVNKLAIDFTALWPRECARQLGR